MTKKNRNTSHPYVPRVNTGGNYCGHDPKSPKLSLNYPIYRPDDPLVLEKKNRSWAFDEKNPDTSPKLVTLPHLFCDAISRFTDYYNSPQRLFPSLNRANETRKLKRNPELEKTIKHRQQRSERRESCIVVMVSVLRYMQLASMRTGFSTPNGFKNISIHTLCKQTSLGLKRVSRALDDLKHAGFLTITRLNEHLADGRWIGLAAVKAVNPVFFEALGLGAALKRARDKASKRLKKQAKKWQKEKDDKPATRTGKARVSLGVSGTLHGQGLERKKKYADLHNEQDDRIKFIEQRRRETEKAVEIKKKNPNWSSAECFSQARAELLIEDKQRA